MKGIGMPNFISPSIIRVLKWILISALALVILLYVSGKILSSYLGDELTSEFEKAGGKIGEVDVNLFTQSVAISDIVFTGKTDSDSVRSTKAEIEQVSLTGVGIYQYVANRALSIREISITNGNLFINRARQQRDTAKRDDVEGLRQLSIDRLKIADVNVTVVSDTIKEYTGVVNATLTGISSSETGVTDPAGYILKDIDVRLSGLAIFTPELYSIEIAKVQANSTLGELTVDSLQLIPKYSKFKFAKVAGKQIDRINTFISKIQVNGLQYAGIRDSSFVASSVKISGGEVHSFRDKREPFRETKVKPLPIAALNDIPYGVVIDTIQIDQSKVAYEEFSPEGFESGTIVFDDLTALLTNISNRKNSRKTKHATLKANAKLMGQAEIDATFELPYDEGENYFAKGTIGKMSLDHLNPPLQNLAFVRIQSGTLEGLTFQFNYNDKISSGKVTINYNDLKIDGLKKEKSTVINDLKTLLINTVIKNDKDKEVPLEKRTGTVDFERDRKRQIFNFWWKSLFSGIKSSVMDS